MIYNGTMPLIYDMSVSIDRQNKSCRSDSETRLSPPRTRNIICWQLLNLLQRHPIVFEGLCRAAGLNVKVYYCTYGSSNLASLPIPIMITVKP